MGMQLFLNYNFFFYVGNIPSPKYGHNHSVHFAAFYSFCTFILRLSLFHVWVFRIHDFQHCTTIILYTVFVSCLAVYKLYLQCLSVVSLQYFRCLADPSGRAICCWDIGSESHRGDMDVCRGCCQVEVSATGPSLIQRNPSECGVSEYDYEACVMKRLLCHGKKSVTLR
jgi:hypothetical protein